MYWYSKRKLSLGRSWKSKGWHIFFHQREAVHCWRLRSRCSQWQSKCWMLWPWYRHMDICNRTWKSTLWHVPCCSKQLLVCTWRSKQKHRSLLWSCRKIQHTDTSVAAGCAVEHTKGLAIGGSVWQQDFCVRWIWWCTQALQCWSVRSRNWYLAFCTGHEHLPCRLWCSSVVVLKWNRSKKVLVLQRPGKITVWIWTRKLLLQCFYSIKNLIAKIKSKYLGHFVLKRITGAQTRCEGLVLHKRKNFRVSLNSALFWY